MILSWWKNKYIANTSTNDPREHFHKSHSRHVCIKSHYFYCTLEYEMTGFELIRTKKNATMCVEWNGTTSCSSRASSHSQREQNTLKCIYVEEQQNRMQRIMKSIAIPIKYEQTRTMALISLWYDLYTQCRTDTGIYTFECIGFGKKIVIGGDAERFHV